MSKKTGFTLIEMMIVVAIIAIIVAMAVPSLLRQKASANESAAAGNIRTISTAEVSFQAGASIYNVAAATGEFGTLANLGATVPPFIDAALAGGVKQGYTYVATPTIANNSPAYTATAASGSTNNGNRGFFCDESGVIRWIVGTGPGTAGGNPL